MSAALVLLLIVAAIVGLAVLMRVVTRNHRNFGSAAEQAAYQTLHTASLAAPALRGGLSEQSAGRAARHFRALLDVTAVSITDGERLLTWDGRGESSPASCCSACCPRRNAQYHCGAGVPVLGEAHRDQRSAFDHTTTVRVETALTMKVKKPVTITGNGVVDSHRIGAARRLTPGPHRVAADNRLTFPTGAAVPVMSGSATADNHTWAGPFSSATGGHPLYATYSLVIATFLGTMGLPHVLRFYTNRDGRAARRTTLVVLGLLGAFYLLPTAYGALGRLYSPELLLTGNTDAVVLLLPSRLLPGTGGEVLSALAAAGAFAAFLSTSSGLAVSVAGVLAQDVLPHWRGVQGFRAGTVLAIVAPYLFAVAAVSLSIADAVGLAFAVAASSLCPLLLLGIWWRGLSDVGAAAGLLVGGGLATTAVLGAMLTRPGSGWWGALLAEPAALTVPCAFVVMIVVSGG